MFIFFISSCITREEKVADRDTLTSELSCNPQTIQEIYRPNSCYYTAFHIGVNPGKKSSKKAAGSLRVDNIANRMKFIFTEPVLGVTLSRVTVSNDEVFIFNPHAEGKQKVVVPLNQFEVSGLGNNNIRLPFRIFRDLLFARLPEGLFSRKTKKEYLKKGELSILMEDGNESISYLFNENRLSELKYNNTKTGIRVDAVLKGSYNKSIFPKTIEFEMTNNHSKEKMNIVFKKLNLKASCIDDYFSTR